MSDTQLKFAGGVAISPVPATCGCELHGFAVKLCPLHAAATDLLAACEAAVTKVELDWPIALSWVSNMKAAIAKAKG